MANGSNIERLDTLETLATNADFYEHLAAGKVATAYDHASTPSTNGKGHSHPYYIPVPITIKSQIGSPTALAVGAFATTLTTLSLSLMGWRGVGVTNAFIGNFFGVAGIGMFVSANWELVLGNTYSYTVLAAFGLFYAGFGFIITPYFGVAESYGGSDTAEYNNALGFWVLMWAVWNVFFLIGSLSINLVFIGIFATVQGAFTLVAAGYFLKADGSSQATAVLKAGGAFAFASGMLGYYTVANLMCSEVLPFSLPMGDTSRFFKRKQKQG
ncbi:hypothetical protein CKM354_000182300 [Cercospora kikuchii]|uniref:Accumulation of dyads protein 2 n=1 Tax=Cercospora kikuchii TaxID=84275 RepID=A0A9P3CBC4_9PEZI|nr:uncharacterized protein CKM354_000182300 [Cercospora kikuchii]GIZ38406.1 hypothetical protein CKM354_000182300 [Cercospora kikuchii]